MKKRKSRDESSDSADASNVQPSNTENKIVPWIVFLFSISIVLISFVTLGEAYEIALAHTKARGLLPEPRDHDPVPWEKWRLVIGHRYFSPKFESKDAWLAHYDAKGSASEKRASDMLDGL